MRVTSHALRHTISKRVLKGATSSGTKIDERVVEIYLLDMFQNHNRDNVLQ